MPVLINSYVHIIQANLGDVHKKSALIFVNLVKIIGNADDGRDR